MKEILLMIGGAILLLVAFGSRSIINSIPKDFKQVQVISPERVPASLKEQKSDVLHTMTFN